ncbi:TetR/AcrR family transcriptional regulator [Nocardioides sp. URHA0020]|uniref:TetR/AcrR family transcriptional regulator n=1 Tax=Nocardioides sp. URHA0020 TaxID=1380392 RepID=UPI00048F0E7A|nr:TetR/AcrR family transcriptional regulator [Nocardioides sp. URHA0020]
MAPATTAAPQRRVPRQDRSRRRFEDLLDAAARLVVERGVDALTTRDIAEGAGAPVGSLYQYFAGKEDVLLALAQRDMEEMDAQVIADLAQLEVLSVAGIVRTTMLAFVSVYRRRRAFVEIYLRGRNNAAVRQFGRTHNERVAEMLQAYAVDAGLASAHLTLAKTLLAVEVGDRVFQLAYESDLEGDPVLIEEGITLVTAYLERYATTEGLIGIRP